MSAITAKASRKMKKYAVLTREPRCFLGSFDFSWEQRKLGELVDRVVRKNTNNESTLPLTISAQYGLVDQITYFNNRVASRDVSNYYLVLNGEFAYNKSTSDGYPFGAVKRLDLYEKGVLSTLYIVFAPKKEQQIDSDYLTVFFDTDRWHKGVAERAAEGARNHGLLNISAEDFFDIDLSVPKDIVEQKQIGAFIRQLDNLITLHQRKCANLCSPSQVVFSLLFATSTFSWEQRKLGDVGETYTGLSGKTKADFGHGQARFVTYMNVFSNPISNPEMTEPIEIDPKQNEVEVGDVFFTTSSETPEEVGMSSVLLEKRGKIYLNSFCFGFRPTEKIDSYYLAYMLRSESAREKIILLAQGISRYNISKNKVMEIAVSLPSLDEQKLIGQYFRQLDNLITLHQRECISFTGRADRLILTANKKRTTSSWEQRKFEEIAVRSSVICSDDTLPRVEYEDIVSGAGRLNKDIYAKQSIKSGIAFHQGDVLYGKLRPYLQNWLLPTFDGLAVGDFWVLQPQNADSSFLYRLIQSRQFDEVANQSTGTKMPRADWKLVSKTVFSIPSNISEQAAIGTYFTALDSLITLHQRKPFLMKWRTSDANRNQTNRLVL